MSRSFKTAKNLSVATPTVFGPFRKGDRVVAVNINAATQPATISGITDEVIVTQHNLSTTEAVPIATGLQILRVNILPQVYDGTNVHLVLRIPLAWECDGVHIYLCVEHLPGDATSYRGFASVEMHHAEWLK